MEAVKKILGTKLGGRERGRERTAKRKYWPSLEGVRRTNFLLNNTYLFSRVPPLSDLVLWQKEPRLSLVDIVEIVPCLLRRVRVSWNTFVFHFPNNALDSLTFNLIRSHFLVLFAFFICRCFLNFSILSDIFSFFFFFFVEIIVTNFLSEIVFFNRYR